MTERYSPPVEDLPQEQIASMHEQAERLFLNGTMRFGGPSPGHYDARDRNSVRYVADTDLVTVVCPTVRLFEQPADGILPMHKTDLPKLLIDSPLPPTDRWPNTYIRHTFLLPRGGRSNLLGAEEVAEDGPGYEHSVSAVHFTEKGEPEEEIELAILGRLSAGADQQADEGEARLTFGQLRSFHESQLSELARVYPDYARLMRPDWAPDYCMERIAGLVGLTAADEVGCDPNPYIRRVETES